MSGLSTAAGFGAPAPVRVRVVVSGRVQGVFFRDSCRERARAEGVGGWVKNCADGSVEAEFEGPRPAVDRLIAWCRTGPARAHVDAVEHTEIPAIGDRRFRIR
jgi:acylphosphatase